MRFLGFLAFFAPMLLITAVWNDFPQWMWEHVWAPIVLVAMAVGLWKTFNGDY